MTTDHQENSIITTDRAVAATGTGALDSPPPPVAGAARRSDLAAPQGARGTTRLTTRLTTGSARRRWGLPAGLAGTLGLAAILLAGCSASGPASSSVARVKGNAPWMPQVQEAAAAAAKGGGATIALTIKDVSTPEGSEPAYVGPGGTGAAVLFRAAAGKTVTVTVKNTDSMPHTFTVPNLNLNEDIGPNATVRFSFSAPAGTYSWYCQVPCGNWVMSHAGYMKGSFTVTA